MFLLYFLYNAYKTCYISIIHILCKTFLPELPFHNLWISSFLLSPALDGVLPTNKSQLAKVKKLLLKDKKKSQGQKIRFVLLKSAGKTVIKDIQIDDLLLEWVRQAKTDNDE